MNLILLVGISGSGKSTWAEKFLAAHPDYIRINRDAIRLSLVKSLAGYYQRPELDKIEGIVNSVTDCILYEAKVNGFNVLIDNTNLTQKYINKFINYEGVTAWQWKLFNIHPDVAKARVLVRDFGNAEIVKEEDIDLTLDKVAYIGKQYEQYSTIKKYLLDNHIHNQYE